MAFKFPQVIQDQILDIQEIPIENLESNFKIRTQLGENQYILIFKWNTRGAFWAMDFMDSEEDPIVYGIKLNEGVDLLFNHKDPRMPPGILQIFDSTLKKQDPNRLELGKRFKLLYAEYEL